MVQILNKSTKTIGTSALRRRRRQVSLEPDGVSSALLHPPDTKKKELDQDCMFEQNPTSCNRAQV
ncbi:hypothetical protein NECAME_01304 [Necator americanus]|uniref:Uncharacterized protein n=1 Tax=Necator americanus TaxID=51031 RepID=W2TWE6_NECAM|nr:hypothetical protein NECAME_01304 [Necator americanus]ETN86178.1 hypothetical protein NECAME_01304 [Necator americanus]